ncbi:hypothetical protein HK101_010531 [Irineochytrium annulatum]|nr:hypothetical protein HK101_010531 [Irineochytrium annulatum]
MRPTGRITVGLLAYFLSLSTIGAVMADTGNPAPSPNKNRTAKIAFGYPFDTSSFSVPLNLALNPLAYIAWDTVLRYVNTVNADDSVLPGLKLELIMENTMYDRGQSLLLTLDASDKGAISILGEASSRNTVPMALAAATKNMLHCMPTAMTMDLSNKVDYPYSFRTGAASAYQARGLIDMLIHYNRADVLIISSNDEFGTDFMATITTEMASHNITVKALVQFQTGLKEYTSYVDALLKGKSATIVLVSYADSGAICESLYNAGVFNGTYMVVGAGTAPTFFTTRSQKKTPLSAEIYNWWYGMPGADGRPVVETNSSLNLCNLTLPGATSCYKGTPYATGALNAFYNATGMGKKEAWNSDQYYPPYLCIDMIVRSLDYWMKKGTLTIDDILSKKSLIKTGGSIAKMINTAQIPVFFGGTHALDKNGDYIHNEQLMNWQYSATEGLLRVPAGKWIATNRTVIMRDDARFLNGLTSPPVAPPIPVTEFSANMKVRYAFDAIIAACAVMTLGCTAYMLANMGQKMFKASSPVFLGLISCGALISYVSIFLFSQYPMTSASCVIYVWLKYLGFSFVFGALLVKTYRIHVICSSKKRQAAPLKDGVMFVFFLCIIAVWCTILIVYTLLPSQRPILALDQTVQIDDMNNVVGIFETPHCNFQIYNYVCLGAMVFTLALGAGLTYLIRNTPSAFNESKWISMATYNWVVIGVVLSAVANFAVHDPDIIFIMEALMITITQGGVVAMMFIPKILAIVNHEEADPSTLKELMPTSTQPSTVKVVAASVDSQQEAEKLRARLHAYEQKYGKM